MRRTIVCTSFAVVTVLALALPATAAPPEIAPGESFEAVIPFPDVCPEFELEATVRGKTHTITFVDASGDPVRQIAAGQLFVTWTRTDTGFSRTFAISGPGFYDGAGNPVRGTGRWTTPLEGTGWALVIGNLTIDGLEDGFALVVDYTGRATSICELMS
ncbi:MAG TPA: hypothetical protein VLA82_13460 [Actinomycetota bacterium]|nr:hypothetical protein [Actinomycetota bacterium]